MATRSRIGVVTKNGKVKSVYCHWNGYPEGVGKDLLSKEFKDSTEVEKFINEGDRSTVETSYKERGEDCPPRTNMTESEYWSSNLEEWGYLYKDGEWFVTKANDRSKIYELKKWK